ncbi:nicotinamidase/pyrazinamidase [Bradyrhizobium barranii subsp. barranii]
MRKTIKADLVIIDPQNDFMDIKHDGSGWVGATMPDGTLYRSTLPVPGALDDMRRVASMLKRVGRRLNDIHVTLDSHRVVDVAHPGFWRGQDGKRPAPFTMISNADIKSGMWASRNEAFRQRMLDYTAALEAAGKFVLMIWPEHCLIGSWGHNVVDELRVPLADWERENFATIDFVTKGTNTFTEHYGALMAEVPDPADPSTQLNGGFLSVLQEADVIGIAGEASSHCVATTIRQIVDNIGDAHLKKIHILTDCMSPVPPTPGSPDFPAIAGQFLKDMEARGLVLTAADDFLR